jgi:hypothetical protein
LRYIVFMKKLFLPILALILLVLPTNTSFAMGSGDKYQDLQTGVTYQILEPTKTLNLLALHFEVRPCRLFPNKDEYLLAGFGSQDHGIALVETAAAFNCTGVDKPQPLGTIKINGIKAKVGIYCSTKCAASTFKQHGGEITFTVPKTKVLGATYVRVGTQGGFTLSELATFARGLKLVGSKN